MKTTGTDFSYEAVTEFQPFDAMMFQAMIEMKQEEISDSISVPDGDAVDMAVASEETLKQISDQAGNSLLNVLAWIFMDKDTKESVQVLRNN